MSDEVDVTDWPIADGERAGGEEKEWLLDPDGVSWLWKPRTEHDGWAQGEDWAEKVVHELARHLGLSSATVDLARRGDRYGSVSRNLVHSGWALHHGAVLIAEHLPEATPEEADRTGHSLAVIERVLVGVDGPDGAVGTAFSTFADYLLLDALVANQDRHAENWAVLEPPGRATYRLAPSYDHGSALGQNLQDSRRELYLRSGLQDWAGKGRAQRFERSSDGRLTLVELAVAADARLPEKDRRERRERLAAVDLCEVERVTDGIERMSEVSRTFVRALVGTNLGRLRDAFDDA